MSKDPCTIDFSARPSECGAFCDIRMQTGDAVLLAKLDREQTFRLAMTLNAMAASMKEPTR